MRRLLLIVLVLLPGSARAGEPPPAPSLPAWEADARALEISRTHAEDALYRLSLDGRGFPGAADRLDAMLADAERYENDLDAFTGRLMGNGMPVAASERNTAYVDAHRARQRALAAVASTMRTTKDPRAAAREALRILAEAQPLPPRDAAAAVTLRAVRRIPPRRAGGDFREFDGVRLSPEETPQDLAPPGADLAAFARTFGAATPQAIAAWIRGAVASAPFHAVALGGSGALRDRRGSAFDSAELLVALLRARDVPARFAYGVVEADAGFLAARLVGGDDAGEAADALALGGVPAERDGLRIVFEHVWVRAKIAGAWVDLDPTFDTSARVVPRTSAGSAAPLHTTADAAAILARYLADPADRTPFGAGLLAAPAAGAPPKRRGRAKKPPPAPAAVAAFSIVTRAREIAAIPAAYRATVGITAGGKAESPLLDVRVPLPDAMTTGILLYPRPPSELDRRIASALGVAATTDPANRLPPHLFDVTMVVSAGGHEIAALPPIAIGSTIAVTVTLFPPNGGPVDVAGWAQSGAPAAITVVPFPPGSGFLAARWHDADVHPEGSAGFARALAATGAQFFADLLDETSRLAERAGGHRFVSPSAVLVAGAFHAPQGLARAPLYTDPAGLTVDVGRLDELLLSRAGALPVEFEVASGAALSAWESRALRITTGLPAVSTVVAAKAGAANGGAPKILRGTARAADLANLSGAGRAEVRAALAAGLVAVLPRAPQALDRWVGESYVLLDPRSGRGAYLIRGRLHGAITTDATASILVALREGGDASAVLAAWRRNRCGRALLAREGWPTGTPRSRVAAGVDLLLSPVARRESVAAPKPLLWPPFGGKSKPIEIGAPIALSGIGSVLWMGNRTRVLDLDVARALAASKNPPATFDAKTRLWTGPTALAIVPTADGPRLLPIPARY